MYPIVGRTHWDPDDPDELRCGLPLEYDFSILWAVTIIDGSGNSRNVLLMRDSTGEGSNLNSKFTGTFSQDYFESMASDDLGAIESRIQEMTGLTIDLTKSWSQGIFLMDSSEISSCL